MISPDGLTADRAIVAFTAVRHDLNDIAGVNLGFAGGIADSGAFKTAADVIFENDNARRVILPGYVEKTGVIAEKLAALLGDFHEIRQETKSRRRRDAR